MHKTYIRFHLNILIKSIPSGVGTFKFPQYDFFFSVVDHNFHAFRFVPSEMNLCLKKNVCKSCSTEIRRIKPNVKRWCFVAGIVVIDE